MPEQTERATEDRALGACAREIAVACQNHSAAYVKIEALAIMRRHGLRGPEPVRPDPLGEALNSGDGSYRP